ncbi:MULTISPECIES: GNAT family N-acetyltransferase [unclassified Legionella]|uniref:GNAT family N-acetyltransferase n=1 Tax=unclassified Legionella TaxID=2622702 RepID=UPI0010561107|nr:MULTISPECIES: GNAT family N-acetyltransferase [unclassified Legionella]MDI9818673.1 GNAT family N-acetyltransferase [Legionella sp. PL877]
MTHGNYNVERLNRGEMEHLIAWATKEGWNPGLYDADCFYQADPHGFFAGKLDNQIIAMGSAVIYDEQFAFCGFYIVDPDYRGQGYGLTLTRARLAYVGQRNAGIDGVVNMVDKYARLGYKTAHRNARYRGFKSPFIRKNKSLVPLGEVNFNLLSYYDRQHFPAAREDFLTCWINQPGGLSLGYISQGNLSGYGVIRACQKGFKIGPLFADKPAIAEELFVNLVSHAQGKDFYIDIPENNPHARELVRRYQLEKIFETARMYLKKPPQLPVEQIYGITTFELG